VALLDKYRLRYSTQIRTNVSNPQDSIPTSPDTARETEAADDVEGEFLKQGITFDVDDKRHVGTGVRGIYAKLLVYTGQAGGSAEWDDFMRDLVFLSKTTSRDRILPDSDSNLTASEDVPGALPAADRRQFNGYVPGSPANPSNQD
jgi:hypothetical protein